MAVVTAAVSEAIQTSGLEDNLLDDFDYDHESLSEEAELLAGSRDARRLRQRSISLDDILRSGFVHESATGERIIISRGWPANSFARKQQRRHRQIEREARLNIRRLSTSVAARPNRGRMDEEQKRRLLMEFLRRNSNQQMLELQPFSNSELSRKGPYGSELFVGGEPSTRPMAGQASSGGAPSRHRSTNEPPPASGQHKQSGEGLVPTRRRADQRNLAIVQYELPAYPASAGPIPLPAGASGL